MQARVFPSAEASVHFELDSPKSAIEQAPFVGVATFGEQGSLPQRTGQDQPARQPHV
jgi:hypothetical protein